MVSLGKQSMQQQAGVVIPDRVFTVSPMQLLQRVTSGQQQGKGQWSKCCIVYLWRVACLLPRQPLFQRLLRRKTGPFCSLDNLALLELDFQTFATRAFNLTEKVETKTT